MLPGNVFPFVDLPNRRDVEFRFDRRHDVNVLYSLEGSRGYAVSGDLGRSEMLSIGKVLYDQLGS